MFASHMESLSKPPGSSPRTHSVNPEVSHSCNPGLVDNLSQGEDRSLAGNTPVSLASGSSSTFTSPPVPRQQEGINLIQAGGPSNSHSISHSHHVSYNKGTSDVYDPFSLSPPNRPQIDDFESDSDNPDFTVEYPDHQNNIDPQVFYEALMNNGNVPGNSNTIPSTHSNIDDVRSGGIRTNLALPSASLSLCS